MAIFKPVGDGMGGDALMLHCAQGWCAAARKGNQSGFWFCRENFLSGRVLQVRHLCEVGWAESVKS